MSRKRCWPVWAIFVVAICGQVCTKQCDIETFEPGDAAVREITKLASSVKATIALYTGYTQTAVKYWGEIACRDKAGSLAPLQRIIRDVVIVQIVTSRTTNLHSLVQFLSVVTKDWKPDQAERAYGFLLSEVQDALTQKYKERAPTSFQLEIGVEIHAKFGAQSKLYTKLPEIVRLILEKKSVRIQNVGSKRFLGFSPFSEQKSEDLVSAKVEEKGETSGWILEATVDTEHWEREEQWARDHIQMVYVRIKAGGIKGSNGSEYLTVRAPPEAATTVGPEGDKEKYNSYPSRWHSYPLEGDRFILALEIDGTVSLRLMGLGFYDTASGWLTELDGNVMLEGGEIYDRDRHGGHGGEGSGPVQAEAAEARMRSRWIISSS